MPSQRLHASYANFSQCEFHIAANHHDVVLAIVSEFWLIDEIHITIDFSFAPIVNEFKAASFNFKTEEMVPPLTVSQHTELFNVLSISVQILSYLALALFILSLFFHKMIGIETVQTLQLIYAMTMLSLNQT